MSSMNEKREWAENLVCWMRFSTRSALSNAASASAHDPGLSRMLLEHARQAEAIAQHLKARLG